MAILIPRVRTIGVRLSEEEYSALEKFSFESAARSMSDVARAAICKFVRKPVRESSLISALEHARQIRDLEQKVSQLNAEVELLKADGVLNTSECKSDCTEPTSSVHRGELPVPGPLSPGDNDSSAKEANIGEATKASTS